MRDAKVYERGVDGTRGEYVGFDPDNVEDVKSTSALDEGARRDNAVKAMTHFAAGNDLSMMRWLYVNGADTRYEDMQYSFPMYQAALRGNLDVCKWLFAHGAARDIKKRKSIYSPLCATFDVSDMRDLSRWLILSGALCQDDDMGDLDVDLMRRDLSCFYGSAEERPELLKWAKEHHQSRVSFNAFLMGTVATPEYSHAKLRESLLARIGSTKAVDRLLSHTPPDEYPLLWGEIFPQRVGCPLAVFCGKSGILEKIGDYVGIFRGREARIIRQLTELLPGVIADLDAIDAAQYRASGDESENDSDSDSVID
jgi:hypothetical protein